MNIGIDARLLSKTITGINRYLYNIIKYLPEYDKENNYTLFTYANTSVESNFYNVVESPRNAVPRQIYEHYWLNFILPAYLSKNKIDIFFTPYILVPIRKGTYKNIIVIHDSMPKACPQYYSAHYKNYLNLVLPPSIKRSDAILTVSESAKADISKYHNVKSEKIHYMHLWTDDKYIPKSIAPEKRDYLIKKYNLPDEYLFYVGAIEERKNINGIIRISDLLQSSGLNIKIVLVGNPGFGFKKLIKEIEKRSDKIIYLKYVEEDDLPYLYNLSKIFLFPSFYEGFGLPPLEALKCGIPVIASDNSSLPEIIGNGGLLSNPTDYNTFARNIVTLLENKEFYEKMKEEALKQAEKFTPQRQLPKLIDLFHRVKNQ